MNKINKIFAVSALALALSACNEGGDSLFNLPGGVSISGEAFTGQTLTATVLDPNGVSESNVSYQWFSNDTEISGATSSTYILTDDELSTTITVTANYTDNDNNDEAVRSAQTAQIETPAVNTAGTVAIAGSAISGQELTATITDDNGIPLEGVIYAWLADTDVIGTDASTVTLTDTEIGKAVTVTVTYTDDDGFSENVTSEATADVTPIPPTAAEFSGNLPVTTTSSATAAITGTITVTDINDGESTFQDLTDIATTYGTFSITTAGAWTYTVDPSNSSVAALISTDANLVDTITVTSFDNTTTDLLISITGADLVPNNVAKITDTVGATPLIPATADDPEIPATSGTVGDLKVITSVLNSEGNVAIGDEATIGEIVAGKVSFSFNNNVGAFDPATELLLPVDNARVSLFGERNAASRALVELRFIHDGTIAIRDDAEQHLIDQTYVAGEWVDVEITWDASSATTSVAPIMNITIDGTPITSSDAALVITNGSYSSLSTHLQHVDTGMQNVQFKLGGTTGTVTDSAFFVDNLKVYSDLAGTVIAFEDNFEQRAVGTLVTNDVDASSPYILNLNNSATPEVVTQLVVPQG